MTEAAKLILDHHEWLNGEGYPRAKIGSSIPWGAQVIRLADSIDIAWQRDHNISLKELRDQISLTIDKEYPNRLARHAFGVLKQNRLFHRIVKKAAIAKLFQEIRKTVGSIHIPAKIDPIGKTLDVIAQIIDMKLPYTSGHSSRVSRYAMTCALAMNLNHDDITLIKWAGLIHDIGKVSVSRKILDKPRKLTKKEFNLVKKHTLMTHKILNAIPSLKDIVPIASSHHESFDGAGYPRGLKGENIPLGARILTICDAFDAMTSTRPYRARLAPKVAYREIENLSGKQFDPGIVKYAIPLFKTLAL
jgi:putative nucleotidyltransferase with HDIG domain